MPMNAWIFPCNAKRDDLEGAVERLLDDRWNTPLQRSQITVGDRMRMAMVGQQIPGAYFLATVTSPPYTNPEAEFGHWRIDIHYDYRIDPFLSRGELLDDPVLGRGDDLPWFPGIQSHPAHGSVERRQHRYHAPANDWTSIDRAH
jgi:hypothetical protein